jgi:hypothetical protein
LQKTRIETPDPSGKKHGEFARFDEFATKLLSVPHSKIKEQLDAEKQRKRTQPKRASASGRASRDTV